MPLAVSCTNEEKVLINATPRTRKGRALPVDAPIVVTVVSGTGTFEMVSDSSFWAISPDAEIGVTEYHIDAVSGGKALSNDAALTVSEAGADSLDLVGEAPVLK